MHLSVLIVVGKGEVVDELWHKLDKHPLIRRLHAAEPDSSDTLSVLASDKCFDADLVVISRATRVDARVLMKYMHIAVVDLRTETLYRESEAVQDAIKLFSEEWMNSWFNTPDYIRTPAA